MDVSERINWLGKAKTLMEMVPEREQEPLNPELPGTLAQQVQTLKVILQT